MASAVLRLLTLSLALQLATSRILSDIGSNEGSVAASVPQDVTDAGVIPGRYVVLFKHGAGPAAQATSLLQQQLSQTVVAASAATNGASSSSTNFGFTVVSSLGESPGSGSSSDGTVRVASSTDNSSGVGIQGLVIEASAVAAERIKQSELVSSVFADRVVKSQADTCVESRYLSSGSLSATPSSEFKWPGCLDANTKLVWVGQRCGNGLTQIEYTAIYAIGRGGRVRIVNGEQCVVLANPTRPVWHRQRFGGCGSSPLYAASLPTRVCAATGGPSQSCIPAARSTTSVPTSVTSKIVLTVPTTCGGRPALRLSYTGVPCGDGSDYVRWTSASTPDGCILRSSTNPKQMKWNNDLFGSCGVPPGNATAPVSSTLCPMSPDQNPTSPPPTPRPDPASPPSPSPSPDSPIDPESSPPPASPSPEVDPRTSPESLFILPRIPVTPGDQIPTGLSRIGDLSSSGVVSTSGLPVSSQVVVGVVDSGVDGTHPDINVVGGKSWLVDQSADAAASEADALADNYGHGTHVAGIAGAKNNGAGVVGVSPGVPIHSLKVLDAKGQGTLSNVLSAVNWALTEGLAKGIRVLNLSVSAFVDPTTEGYADTFNAVCSVFQQASDAGVLVAVAAGNYAANLQGYLPAACPSVAAVTAVNADGRGNAAYSNWLPQSAGDDAKARVIAAPGTSILSTISYVADPSGYKMLSGTSMAAPHVAGVAANCIMAGACPSGTTGQQVMANIQALARQRLTFDSYGFTGDPTSTVNGKYMGYLVWSGF